MLPCENPLFTPFYEETFLGRNGSAHHRFGITRWIGSSIQLHPIFDLFWVHLRDYFVSLLREQKIRKFRIFSEQCAFFAHCYLLIRIEYF